MKTNITIALAGLLALGSCDNAKQQQQMPAPTIPVVEVTTKDMTGYRSYPVNIEGKVNNAVRAKISGYIKEVYVDEGHPVTRGQALFRLETDVLSQNANAARSGISAARANVTAAQASVNAAQVEVNKLIPLVEKNIISTVQLETAKANLAGAKGQLEQAKAAQSQAQANFGGVQANIDFAVVRSPITGTVGSINFREGSLVGPSDPMPLTTVSQTNEVYAYFSMNEGEYLDFLEDAEGKTIKEKLNQLPEVDLILANGQAYPEKGKIQTVTGQIDPQTGSIKFRAMFTNANGLLSNGNSGFIHLPKSYGEVLIIPENATFEQQGIVYVYTVKNDTVHSTSITIKDRMNNTVIVNSGLEKGDIVATKGIGKLRNEAAIQPQKVNMDSIINSVKTVK